MTDSFKLAEMQRTSIEFERQRHLANWFIKSSPHMATPQQQPPPQPQSQPSLNPNGSINNDNLKNNLINKEITTNNKLIANNDTNKLNITTNNTINTNTINSNNTNIITNNENSINTTTTTTITTTNNIKISNNSSNNGEDGNLTNFNSFNTMNVTKTTDSNNTVLINNNSNEKSSLTGGTKNGTITGNPLFFLVSSNGQKHHQQSPSPPQHHPQQQQHGGGGGNLALSRTQLFNSQTNLPLQLVGNSNQIQEGRKPKLRRFNSHDTSPNMFSVADFENARLARRNEIEMKQRQQQRLKMNSLSSGGDCSTGDSKGSKYSNDSQTEPLPADAFLERYSLPRIVRVSHKPKFSHETLQSSSSNGSASTTQSATSLSNTNKINNNNNNNCDLIKQNGELFLLYRHLRQRHNFHGFNSKTNVHNRKKGVIIPQEYPGFFSLMNDKGLPSATQYTTLIQLVRERVYKFISVDTLPAFTESQTSNSSNDVFLSAGSTARPHYNKTSARGGQVFRLLAVFEDGKETSTKTASSTTSSSGREKEKGRYAQLLNENRQIIYVSLSTKGKFYEIEPGIPQILQKNYDQQNAKTSKKKLNPDCVHKINAIMTPDKSFPLNLKFISGPSGNNGHPTIPENLTISKMTDENIIVACPIDDFDSALLQSPFQLQKIVVNPELNFLKCLLGFENEKRMLANPNVQNLLKFCQFNCDPFLKLVTIEILNRPTMERSKTRVDSLKILKPLNFPKLLRREKSALAHEKEDSIIFLSKNDLANLESKEPESNQIRISDKMKVFQSTKKKWFKRNDNQKSMTSLDIDVQAKRMSMQRYNDMSKLLQERFGGDALRSSDDDPISEIEDQNCGTHIKKSLSLQEVDFKQPDLVPNINGDSNEYRIHDKQTGNIEKTAVENNIAKKIELNRSSERGLPSTSRVATNDIFEVNLTEINGHDIKELDNENIKKEVDINYKAEMDENDENDENDKIYIEQHKPQQSFISEKLYNEFHVKTRQYSKSSSSLNQLLHFAVPQKMNVVEMKKPTTPSQNEPPKKLEFVLGDNGAGGESISDEDFEVIDDLPYSSVRDSLIITPDDASIMPSINNIDKDNLNDSRENIYAEICQYGGNNVSTIQTDGSNCENFRQASAVSRIQINGNDEDIIITGSNTIPNTLEDGANSVDNIYNTIK